MQKCGNRRDLARFFFANREFRTSRIILDLQGSPSLPRLCGKDGDLTYVDWRGLKKSGQAGRRPRALDWHVFDVRSDVPLVAEIILYCGVAVAVRLIRRLLE
jgi:hypothetical protein